MTPAVPPTAPWYYSASQLKRADLCIRAWAWEQLCGFREPPGAPARLGLDVHNTLEKWFRNGTAPDVFSKAGSIAAVGLPWLPAPGPELEVERQFRIRVGQFSYRGYVDLGFMGAEGVPWVVDHKTTRDFAWALTPEDLMYDPQALIYAKEALDRYNVDEVQLRWVYYLTTKPHRSRVTDLRLQREQVDQCWSVIDDLARNTEQVRLTVVDPLQLPPNAKACSAFGGCPHVKRCNLTIDQRIDSIMENKKSILERMKNRRASGGAAAPRSAPANAPAANAPHLSAVPNPAQTPAPTAAAPPAAPAAAAPPVSAPTAAPQTEAPAGPPGMNPEEVRRFYEWQAQQNAQGQVPPSAEAPAAAPAATAPAGAPAAPVVQQQAPAMNPPEQPPVQTQLSSEITEERQGRASPRANEGEATAAAESPKPRKPRQTKPKGLVIDDVRTAQTVLAVAAVLSGNANWDVADEFVRKLYE